MKFWEELKQFASCFEDDVNDKDGKDKEDGEADGKQNFIDNCAKPIR